jgi:hypothetical protein
LSFHFSFWSFFFAGVPYFIFSLKFSPIPLYVCVFWGSTPFFYLIDTPIERFSIVFQYFFFLSSSHQYKLWCKPQHSTRGRAFFYWKSRL